jgi:phenylacetate-CoA ligase
LFIPHNLTKEKLNKIQLQGLKQTINNVYNNSNLFCGKYKKAGLLPSDIKSLDDLNKIPFLDKEDLRQDYPLALKSVNEEEIVRIHGSSGTTGKRKIMCYTQNDINTWADMFARCYELAGMTKMDRVHIAVGYGLWTAGAGFQLGCERFGAMAVPMGPVHTDMHIDMLVDMQSTVFCATASMALLIAEEIHKRNLNSKINIKKIIMGAERHSQAMRDRIKELMGIDEIYDIYGMTEAYGPGTGLDCMYHNGIHYWEDLFIYEIIDPETLKVLPDGETGELVITSLQKEASPLIRYRTHDLTRIVPGDCSCGVSFKRHDRIMGRSDDMFIYRAVNIYPSQIDYVLNKIKGISSEYQIHLDHKHDGRDIMTIMVEREGNGSKEDDANLSRIISDNIRKNILVRANVEIKDINTLPRTQRKSQRVFDNRNSNLN